MAMTLLRLQCLLMLLCAAAVAGCGWQLRGLQNMDMPAQLELSTPLEYSEMALALDRAMRQYDIERSPQAPMELKVGRERLSKHTVAVTSIGSPSQYELTLEVEFQYLRGGQALSMEMGRVSTQRIFDFDPSNTVAKTQEENTLLEEMRQELALRILERAPALATD